VVAFAANPQVPVGQVRNIDLAICVSENSGQDFPLEFRYKFGDQAHFIQKLAGPFDNFQVATGGNDYCMMTAEGCYVYLAYFHPDQNGVVNLYFRSVFIGEPGSDVNCGSTVDSLDLIDFADAFGGGSGRADFNGDGEVNALDAAAFLDDYAQHAEP
jgi:hypothetical protein